MTSIRASKDERMAMHSGNTIDTIARGLAGGMSRHEALRVEKQG